jgi:alpha-galactosidase
MSAARDKWWNGYTLSTATIPWFREYLLLPNIGIDDFGSFEVPPYLLATLAHHSLSNHGSFSTGTYLPMGLLKARGK